MTDRQFMAHQKEIIRWLKLYRADSCFWEKGYRRGIDKAIREIEFQSVSLKVSTNRQMRMDKRNGIIDKMGGDIPPSLIAKREFLKLPMDERRRILKEQANKLAGYYEQNRDIDGIGGGDFVDGTLDYSDRGYD